MVSPEIDHPHIAQASEATLSTFLGTILHDNTHWAFRRVFDALQV